MEYVEKYIGPLKFEALDQLESLKFIEQKYKVKPSAVLLIAFAVLILLSPFLNTHNILASIVCYLIPAYLSFVALESTDKEDDIRYLTYWIIFSLVEVSTPLFKLFFNKFMFMSIRVLVTVVLLHPLSNIASTIYNNFVRPFLAQHEKQIDEKLEELAKEGKKKLIQGAKEVITKI